MMIMNDQLVLRDLRQDDISRRLHWETEENEWQLWDAPWEYENLSKDEALKNLESYRASLTRQADRLANPDNNGKRNGFEIEERLTGRHIGWVGSYMIDAQYRICSDEKESIGLAVGIDIPDMSARGKGLGLEALRLFIAYIKETSSATVYTQTWSGNRRMIALAEKLGFVEINRYAGIRQVRGETYDGLTFRLNA